MFTVKMYRKANGKLIYPRKEIAEQTRIRNSFERKLYNQLISDFKKIGRNIGSDLRQGQRTPISLERIEPIISDTLVNHYKQVITHFAERTRRIFENTKEMKLTPFERYVDIYLAMQGGDKITGISNTTRRQIMKIITAGHMNGLGQNPIAKNIRDFTDGGFSRHRSATIARTETHSASVFANHSVATEQNIPDMEKRWISTNDGRTRQHHALLNGTTIPKTADFVFTVGATEYRMAHPADPRGGAINNINCRCVLAYIVPTDTIVDPTTPPPTAPKPPPVQSQQNISIFDVFNNPEVTTLTVPLLTAREVNKRIRDIMVEANKDDRYFNKTIPHYRRTVKGDYGNFKYEGMNLESRSAILAVLPEVQAICTAFNVPMIRGIKSSNARAYASMGDGVLTAQIGHFQQGAQHIGLKKLSDKDKADNDRKEKRREKLRTQIKELQEKLAEIPFGTDYPTSITTPLSNAQKKLSEITASLLTDPLQKLTTSTWRRGDSVRNIPYHTDKFVDNWFDRLRTTIFHEVGHHIHQMYKLKIADVYARKRREQNITRDPYWYEMERPLEEYINNRKGIKKGAPSEYGFTNNKEWWCENFSLYYLGTKYRDLVDPIFVDILKDINDGKI